MILFVASKVDPAGLNIASRLIEIFNFTETAEEFCGNPVYTRKIRDFESANLVFVNDEPVNTQNLPYPKDLRIAIFISRHSSKSGIPTLSVHTPGNLSKASLGGISRKVSISPASAMKAALIEINRAQKEMHLKYNVSYECTHHGPSLDFPAMFVELGSSPEQWRDTRAAEAVAMGAMFAAINRDVYPAVLGIGGQHYNEKFTRIALTSDLSFGHIIPKYAIHEVDGYVLGQCITRTVELVERIILDWKGIKGDDKEYLLRLLRETGLEIEKV